MVKVFTLEELANQEIPRREDYRKAVDILRKKYETLVEECRIYGALLYGSLFLNGGNEFLIGSDIDQMVVVNSMDDQTLNQLRALREIVSELRVPTEFHVFDADTIREGYHGYDKTFLYHLRLHVTKDGMIGNNILDLIKPDSRTDYDILKDRQVKNFRRLSRDVSAPKYSRTHCTFLGRIINYTIYLARDMINLKLGEPAIKDEKLVSKDQILERYATEFPQIDASTLRNILELRAQYRGFLDDGVPYDIDKYRRILDQIDCSYPMVQKFIRANLKVAEKIERT